MDKKQKTNKTDSRSKKVDSDESLTNNVSPLESKFKVWKKKSKRFKHFPFLDNTLFADYLAISTTSTQNGVQPSVKNHKGTKLTEALKYRNVIKYIEQHSDSAELDVILHNIAFVYNIDKDILKNEALSSKIPVRKAPNNTSVELHLKQLMQENDDDEDLSPSMTNNIEILIPAFKGKATSAKREPADKKKKTESKAHHGIDLKGITSLEELDSQDEVSSKLKKALERQVDGEYPMKKKVKDNSSQEKEVVVEKKDKKKRNGEEKKKVEKNGKKEDGENEKNGSKEKRRSRSTKDVVILDEDEEEIIKLEGEDEEQLKGQYVELQINNEVDSDEGENFSFFFVNESVHNKTQHYFEKKLRPTQICSCVEGCNDPTVCPCARYNFDMGGRTTCYVYDNKYGKKRLLNHLIKKDMHVYECSAQCACNKSLCLNSCINEGPKNKLNPQDFVIERYRKTYQGTDTTLKNFSAVMWGLKTKAFIPANTYIAEYCGEVITKKEGDRRGEKYDSVNCNYLFDLNKHAEIEKIDESTNTILMNIDGVCESRNINKLKDIAENFPLVIDAFFYGNHGRFINHRCSPNMVALAVHVENRNILLPRIIFFALKDIQPGEELTIDYNCAPLKDLDNTDQLPCLCGAPTCRGFVYEEAHESDQE